ncbi:unnamed protein product [Lactuca virosa]|uniref:Trafficking protein particle complex subunit 13 n=1 Tax=Lactuca virosa TaxID=75947 RepID=A0AAU9LWR6_9ASTR|nr:unnamed protein product [Lactuca virosa]
MSSTQSLHSLAFRVMRLCRPTFHVETPLRFDPCDLVVGEDLFDSPSADTRLLRVNSASFDSSPADLTYRNRFLLRDDSDAMGVPGLLVLPQSFGAIYLGETFCSYISINNSSNFEVRDIIIKSEIQTERQRILLLDTTKAPVESIRAGGRYDFIVEHDVKELGAHTLVCTALYYDGDAERKYLPQYFKFMVSNPLSVRTKVRVVKWNLSLLQDGVQPYLKLMFIIPKRVVLLERYLSHPFLLDQEEITWRTNLGEPGRLQTQQIIGNATMRKEIDLRAVQVPPVIMLEKPFTVHLSLTNLIGKKLGPFEVSILSLNDSKEEKDVMISGLQMMNLPEVEAFESLEFQLNLISARHGVQKISGITVFDTIEKKTLEPLADVEIFVDSDL